ncbi:MAG: hypothetical protein P1V81_13295 [Planctomycetota bacterium]|nr:hypothetical protein [Planctomycetota bacterium]
MQPLPTALAAALLAASASAQTQVDVLLLGNSYTQQNDLPSLLTQLAAAAGHNLVADSSTPGGCTWGSPQGGIEHTHNPASQAKLAAGPWDFVVLQEQSVTPAIPGTKDSYMLPAAQVLEGQLHLHAASPLAELILFQTWGREAGGTVAWGAFSASFADFDAMQDALTAGYAEAAALTGATVAPVGEAWRLFFQQNPGTLLHAADGSHPNPAGSYLAACVLFATIFDASPLGNGFHHTLTASQAAALQGVAAEAVFGPTCGVTSYGLGLGPAHTLVLGATGGTGPGDSLTVVVTGLPVTAGSSLVATALAEASAPLFGGTLLVDLAAPVLPLKLLPAGGSWTLTLPTDPAFTGLDVFLQAAAPDPAQPAGWAFSGGLHLELCP